MNIKAAAFTVSEKSINTQHEVRIGRCVYNNDSNQFAHLHKVIRVLGGMRIVALSISSHEQTQ